MRMKSGLTAKIAITVLLLFPIGHAYAQLQAENLLTSKTMLLVEIGDSKQFIDDIYVNWYSAYFSKSIDEKKLSFMQLPSTEFALSLGSEYKKQNWLMLLLDSMRSRSAKDLKKIASECIKDGKNPDEFIQLIAKIVPANVMVAIDQDSDGKAATVFRLGLEQGSFDWYEECLAMAKGGNGPAKPILTVDGTDLFSVDNDNLYFFMVERNLYGVIASSSEYCKQLLKRVKGESSGHTPLSRNRSYQRVMTHLRDSDLEQDFIAFMRTKNLIADDDIVFKNDFGKPLSLFKESYKIEFDHYPAESIGLKADLSRADGFQFHVACPLIEPQPKAFNAVMEKMETLDPNSGFLIPNWAASATWLKHKPLGLSESIDSRYRFGNDIAFSVWHRKFVSKKDIKRRPGYGLPNPANQDGADLGLYAKMRFMKFDEFHEFFDDFSIGNASKKTSNAFWFSSSSAKITGKEIGNLAFANKEGKATGAQKQRQVVFSELDSNKYEGGNLVTFASGKDRFLFANPWYEGALLMEHPRFYSKFSASTFADLIEDKPSMLDIDELFGPNAFENRDLKVVVIQNSLLEGNSFDEAYRPFTCFMETVFPLRTVLDATELETIGNGLASSEENSLFKLARLVGYSAFSGDSLSNLNQSVLPLRFRSNQTQVLTLSKSDKCVEFFGAFLSRSAN